jgi:hypothetical protein
MGILTRILAEDMVHYLAVVSTIMNLRVPEKAEHFLTS